MKDIREVLFVDGHINKAFFFIDGHINKKELDACIADVYGVLDNDSKRLLISEAINNNEINFDMKLELVIYLMEKGFEIQTKDIGKFTVLSISAIQEKNFDLPNLLFKSSLKDTTLYFYKENFCKIVLKLREEQVLRWILEHPKFFLFHLDMNEFRDYYQQIRDVFPDCKKKDNELHNLLEEVVNNYVKNEKENISNKFKELGLINRDHVPLILAATGAKKSYKDSIFVIKEESEIALLIEQIKNLLQNETRENIIKFQIIHFPFTHATYGEFRINKTGKVPVVQYIHCDAASGLTPYSKIATPEFIKEISLLANIEIYESSNTQQKGKKGCSYFSIEGARKLETPFDKTYVVDVVQYMKDHGKEKLLQEKVKYIESPLPARFITGSHYFEDEETDQHKIQGLNSLIFLNELARNTVVNKKGETAIQAITKSLREQPSKSKPDTMRKYNERIERKMRAYGQEVDKYIEDKDIVRDPKFVDSLNRYTVKQGLVEFCKGKMTENFGNRMMV